MRTAVLDIETFANINDLEYLDYRYLKTRGKEELSDEELEKRLALNPYTLSVISAALAHLQESTIERVTVYYLSQEGDEASEEKGDGFVIQYFPIVCPSLPKVPPQGERLLLANLWEELKEAERIVTYNGQNFDLPVLRIRSMVHGLDLPASFALPRLFRFFDNHLDLADFLSGANPEHRYSLEFVCRSFGIPFQKGTLDGSKVRNAFLEGYYFDIARYNARDTIATAMLFLRIEKYLSSEAITPEPPATERQVQFLANLFRAQNPEGLANQAFLWLAQEGVLTKSTVTWLIDRLKGNRFL